MSLFTSRRTLNNHKFGWVRDLPDQRDHEFLALPSASLPAVVDLRSAMPPVYDQGQLGSCTANAIAGHLDFNRKKQGEAFISPSRLFIYYQERLDQGTVASDSGASIRESVKAVKAYGACPEKEWKYDIGKFTNKPNAKVYADAIKYEALSYQRINRALTDFKTCLADGYPFVIGFTVYDSFEGPDVAKSGIMPMPATSESVLGGHAVVVVGYDESKQWFIVRNSWGKKWGDKGYFYMPYAYLLDSKLSSDFWTLRQVK